MFIIVCLVIFLLYCLEILRKAVGFLKTERDYPQSSKALDFTIMVVFRNEQKKLPALLESFSLLKYPSNQLSFLFLDDGSSDNSAEILRSWLVNFPAARLVNSPGKGKKAGIEYGVLQARNDHILLTDADCRVSQEWVEVCSGIINREKPDMLVMPVLSRKNENFFGKISELDFLSLIAFTLGSRSNPMLCNAANLYFNRSAFLETKPYSNNLHIPTGDDLFMLQAFKRSLKKISISKARPLWVYTDMPETFQKFWNQRVRWGSKTINYNDTALKYLALLVFLSNLMPWLLLLFSVKLALFWFIAKVLIDALLIFPAANYFEKRYLRLYYLPFSIFYIFYVPLAALAGLLKNVIVYRKQ